MINKVTIILALWSISLLGTAWLTKQACIADYNEQAAVHQKEVNELQSKWTKHADNLRIKNQRLLQKERSKYEDAKRKLKDVKPIVRISTVEGDCPVCDCSVPSHVVRLFIEASDSEGIPRPDDQRGFIDAILPGDANSN